LSVDFNEQHGIKYCHFVGLSDGNVHRVVHAKLHWDIDWEVLCHNIKNYECVEHSFCDANFDRYINIVCHSIHKPNVKCDFNCVDLGHIDGIVDRINLRFCLHDIHADDN
jgi:hypothetical protein